MSDPHWQRTRLLAGECPVVLLIQDTTWIDYSAHPRSEGLGHCGRKPGTKKSKSGAKVGHGLFLHSVLAVEPQEQSLPEQSLGDSQSPRGRVLGLAWARTYTRQGELQADRSKRRRDPDRESQRWVEAIETIGAAPPSPSSPTRWLHVGDRESDLFDVYEKAGEIDVGFVIRLSHDRNALIGHDTPEVQNSSLHDGTSLKDLCRALPSIGTRRLWIAPKGGRGGGRAGRWATLNVSAGAVTIYSPRTIRNNRAMRLWAVRAWEANPPEGTDPIEWMILTSEKAESPAEALKILGYYTLRWLIEEYHKCLKSGCKVEERQLESIDRLEPLIGMLSILAVRLLSMKNDARLTPEKPAIQCVPPELLATLAMLIGEKNPATITVRRFVHEVAKRGGFLARKRDGEPGWLTLRRGWHELTLIHIGVELTKKERYG